MQHLKAAHKGYKGLTNANGTLQPNITAFLSVDKNDSLNKWANWIVIKFLPIGFCEDHHTRACTKLPRVSRRTLKAHMFAVMKTVEEYIRKHPP
ncbi:hypothetical protein GN958_ATG08029 [Phytophthora infestans]|uniref:Uncharacterized protein n=1 Tax=Phytophthora infestans TaxID=4787 RepID=A0A8S9UPS5_PHYIN|nr:hypothetical protein GN958_ATG08029 [Phytophthora infestans]